jgi:uncharacterized protein (DUF1810 family)
MTTSGPQPVTMNDDPFDLARFESAQAPVFAQAMAELRAGRKRSHWMWFVFPQFRGLGLSPRSQRYAIRSLDEARAYLAHPVLGPRLRECTSAVLELEGRSAHDIFGSPDDLKLRSCATLFAAVSPPGSEWDRLLGKYFDGRPDEATLELLH